MSTTPGGADRCRFCRLYAISVVAFAALLGALTAAQLWLEQLAGAPGGPFPLLTSALRSLAPAASGSALLLSLVIWSHGVSVAELQTDLRRILNRGLMVSLPGYAVSVLVAGGVSALALLSSKHGYTLAGVGARDVLAGVLVTLIDTGLITFLAARFLPRLQQTGLSLPGKLVLALSVSVAMRATLGLLAASALSG